MFGLMAVIAAMDNSRSAIGYSVYAYAADMYGSGDEIKLIKVDGVAPSKAAFADRTYPLMGLNFAIYRVTEPDGSPARQLVNWMLSKEGQLAIAEAGYITIADTGYDYTEATLDRRRLEWTELFEGDWLDNSTMRLCYPDEPVDTPYYEGLETRWFQYDSTQNIFTVCLADSRQEYYLYIPGEYARF